ncbi:MAG TPA: hypothetical protein VFC05_15220 [Nitrososphaeraceae archaeon]|nr:hypothetical protein [Nitrososphaeraceae archaeon]
MGQNETQHQVQGLLGAFRLLYASQHRTSRRIVFRKYFEYLDTGTFEGSAYCNLFLIVSIFDYTGCT